MKDKRETQIGTKRSRLLWLPIDLFAAFLVAYLVIRQVTTGHYWPVEIISVFAQWLLLIALILIPLAYWMRRWSTVVLLAIGGSSFLWLFAALFLPRAIRGGDFTSASGQCGLTVMTYNLSNGIAGSSDLSDVISSSSADIVGVQEFTSSQIAEFRTSLRRSHPYQFISGNGMSGLGLFSRFPMIEEDVYVLGGSRSYLDASITDGSCTVRVLVAHPPVIFGPGAPQSPDRADMPMLAEFISNEEDIILLGDFNFTDQNESYDILKRAGWVDAFRATGMGFGLTYPKRSWSGSRLLPLLRIDFIFLTPGIHPVESWVGDDGGSDHLPVLAEVYWGP